MKGDIFLASTRNQALTPLAIIVTAVLCIIFGVNPVAVKISLTGIGTFTLAGLRFALAACVIFLWAVLSGRPMALPRTRHLPMLIVSLLFTLQLSLFYLGISKTLASRSALISNLVPFFVLILAHFFIPGDRMNARKVMGMIIGFVGVALMFMDDGTIQGDLRTGDLLNLLAVLVWAVSGVYSKTIIEHYHPIQMVLYPMVFSVPVFFLEGWLWDERMISYLNGPVVAGLLFQSLLSAAVGFVVWFTLLQRYGASTLHSFVFIMPISGVAAGALILNEPVTHHIIFAALLVAVGVGIVNSKSRTTIPAFPVDKG